MDIELTAAGVALVPIITALVEVIKRMGFPAKYAPIPALIFGVAAGVLYVAPDDVRTGLLAGLLMGLSSIGVYEAAKDGGRAVKRATDDPA